MPRAIIVIFKASSAATVEESNAVVKMQNDYCLNLSYYCLNYCTREGGRVHADAVGGWGASEGRRESKRQERKDKKIKNEREIGV